MPQLVPAPTRIDEYVGHVTTSTPEVSVAHMVAPAGWDEPAQTPDFDEITVVLRGVVLVEHDAGVLEVAAGQAVITRAGVTGFSDWAVAKNSPTAVNLAYYQAAPGLPVGLQLIGPALGDVLLLELAEAFQRPVQDFLAPARPN